MKAIESILHRLTKTNSVTLLIPAFCIKSIRLFTILFGSLSVCCGNDKPLEQPPPTPSSVSAAESNSSIHLAKKLVSTLTLTPRDRGKFLEKLVKEIGKERGMTFLNALNLEGYRGRLAELFSQTFNEKELKDLAVFAKESRIVRLSLLTAPHTLSDIPGMGAGDNPSEEWNKLRDEVEFFGIANLEEFKDESRALQHWDKLPFLDKFEKLKEPMETLINTHLFKTE